METQRATLNSVLSELQAHPRLTSIHSFQAANEVLAELDEHPIEGAILHWWLGDAEQTQRALGLGCYFSINASSVRRAELLAEIPLDRVLTETDHPFGDRTSETSRPGAVTEVEEQLAAFHGISPIELRFTVWDNFSRLVGAAGCAALLPRAIRVRVAAL